MKEERDKIRKSLLIKNDNVLTMAQLIKSDKLLSKEQIDESIQIKKYETQVEHKNINQDMLNSSKVIMEEATDENVNESNFIYNGTNLDYSGDVNSQSQDLRSGMNLK